MKGITNGFGIFQRYLIQHQLSSYTQDDIAWIGSVQIFLSFLGGLFSGRSDFNQSFVTHFRLCDTHGPRWLLLFGSICYLLSLLTTGLCTEYWQFFLAQALLTGLGSGFTYNSWRLMFDDRYMVMLTCIQGYFSRKRALALGIYSSGVSLGGGLCTPQSSPP
jgi:MFS family permease